MLVAGIAVVAVVVVMCSSGMAPVGFSDGVESLRVQGLGFRVVVNDLSLSSQAVA